MFIFFKVRYKKNGISVVYRHKYRKMYPAIITLPVKIMCSWPHSAAETNYYFVQCSACMSLIRQYSFPKVSCNVVLCNIDKPVDASGVKKSIYYAQLYMMYYSKYECL